MISGHGNSHPEIIFIADGGSSADVESNLALSGYSSKLISEMCRKATVSAANQYYTCLIKERINPDKFNIPKNLTLVPGYAPILLNEINELNPFLLVPLGELSFRYLTGNSGIRKFRGSILHNSPLIELKKKFKVLPILGPNPYLNQEPRLKWLSQIDFNKIPRYLNDSDIPDNVFNVWICKNSTALRNFIDRTSPGSQYLVFDIETYMGIPTCISFCFDGLESVCIPFLDKSIDFDSRAMMVEQVVQVLADPKIRKVNQNIKYDWKCNERWGLKVSNVVGDTMLAANCIYSEFPKNLGFLTSIYTDFPYFKDEGKDFDPTVHKRERFYLYNAKDSLAAHQIYSEQQKEITHFGVREVYEQTIQLMPIYRRMEDTGFKIDDDVRLSLLAKYISLYEIELLKLKGWLGKAVNPLSPKQSAAVIFDELGYDKIRGVKGTQENDLEILKSFGAAKRSPIHGRDILDCFLVARKIHKVIELLDTPLHPDGRFRCEFNLAGTENGRTSAGQCTDRLIIFDKKGKLQEKKIGHSLQTIGKHGFDIDGDHFGRDVREMFVADYGYSFVEIDQSQAEARVDAVLAGNYDILSVFDGPLGIHRLTGSWVYGCEPSEIKKGVLIDGFERYHVAKQVRHAGERNITPHGLIAKLVQNMTLKEGTRVLKVFHKYQPEIRGVFHKDIREQVNKYGVLTTPNGRRRQFFDRVDEHLYNEAISFLPQAIVGDQTKFAMIPTYDICRWAFPVMEAHDGHLALVPKGREMEFAEVYCKEVERGIDFSKNCSLKRDFVLKIPTEVSIGENWGHMTEVKR